MTSPHPMHPIRIGIAAVPPLARDVLHDTFARHQDFEVLDLAPTDTAPMADASPHNCDVIVRSAPPQGELTTLELHERFGRTERGTLVVLVDNALIRIAELREASSVVDPSPDALVEAIRSRFSAMHTRER